MTMATDESKEAAIQGLSDLFDFHAEQEQTFVLSGNVTLATKHHAACAALALAIKDEIDDRWPMPEGAWCDCHACKSYLLRQGRAA